MTQKTSSIKGAIHFAVSLLTSALLIFWLFSNVLEDTFLEKSVYPNAEIRFNNVAGERVADYAIKKKDHSFLIASQIPKEVALTIEIAHTGSYSALIRAEYPHWLCKPNEINKASVYVVGGSVNERVSLIDTKPDEIYFSIAKGQKLKFSVGNPVNNDCGRAVVTFYKNNYVTYVIAGFCLAWALVFLLLFFAGASPHTLLLGLLTNIILIAADSSLGAVKTSSLIVNTGLSLIVVSGLLLFATLPRSRVLSILLLVALICLYTIPLAFTAYAYVFETPITGEAIHGAMQSYDSQMIEFWQQYIGKKRTLYALLAITPIYLSIRQINLQRAKFRFAFSYSLVLLLMGLAIVAERLHQSYTTNLLMASMIEYKWEIEAFKKISDQRKNVAIQAVRAPEHANDTTVIVIGESVNKKFMSAYGYVQDTTPGLDKRIEAGESVLFKNAYSNHTHSNPTMSLILTRANQYNEQKWLESPSVFNFAKSASVDTHWLTNHRLLGGWSNQITTIVREADYLKTINFKIGYGSDSSNYDHELIPLYKEALAARPKQLTFLHLYNSHLFYCNRYPPGSKEFPSKLTPAIFGEMGQLRKTSEGLLGCYVNTIHYTDTVLEQLISELENKPTPSVLVYVTDHAEEPIDQRTHNSGQFTYDMINIPLFVWANEAWREKHSEKWENLQTNKEKVVTNDLMFESFLGIAGIESPELDSSRDISSRYYRNIDKPLTLHGRTKIDGLENWNYWQSQNSALAVRNGVKLVAVDIESVGQAFNASSYGIKQLHLNAHYSEEAGVQIVSKTDSSQIIALPEFLTAVRKLDLNSLSLSLNSQDQNQLDSEIKRLSKEYAVAIKVVSKKADKLLPLFSKDFPNLMKNAIDSAAGTEVWVTFKSRYTDLPPIPKLKK